MTNHPDHTRLPRGCLIVPILMLLFLPLTWALFSYIWPLLVLILVIAIGKVIVKLKTDRWQGWRWRK